jgi:hypothetical protein
MVKATGTDTRRIAPIISRDIVNITTIVTAHGSGGSVMNSTNGGSSNELDKNIGDARSAPAGTIGGMSTSSIMGGMTTMTTEQR